MLSKIAFLFLTIGNIYHEQWWINFFAGHERQYSIYVHCKNNISENSFFKPFQISQRVNTSMGKTMRAQLALLEEALKDERNEKFVFISESTIPLQPFSFVYETLMEYSLSIFGFNITSFESLNFGMHRKNQVYKNSQWTVLNRKHAQMMVNDEDQFIIKEFTNVLPDNETYPSTFLALHNELQNVVNKSTTLVIWDAKNTRHPHTFEHLANDKYTAQLRDAITNKTFLFARKFSKQCDLTLLKKGL